MQKLNYQRSDTIRNTYNLKKITQKSCEKNINELIGRVSKATDISSLKSNESSQVADDIDMAK